MKLTIGVPSKRVPFHPAIDEVQTEASTELDQKLPVFINLVIRVISWEVYNVLWEALSKNVVIPVICGVIGKRSCPGI